MYFFDKNESFYERTMLIVDSQEKRSYTYREIYTLQEQILSTAPSGSLLFLLCRTTRTASLSIWDAFACVWFRCFWMNRFIRMTSPAWSPLMALISFFFL